MKIRSDIHAGAMSLQECQNQRDYWKAQANKMQAIATGPGKTNYPPYYPPSYPPTSGGGYVGGVYYADKSGSCG